MIDEDFLRDEEDPAGMMEPLDVERAVVVAELHQVDARQVAGRVVEEHVLASTGFEALIRPEFGQVCQWLIVVSYCTPGSPHDQAHSAMRASMSRAG